MLSIFRDVFATASRTERMQRLDRAEWEERFAPRHGRQMCHGVYRFDPNRHLW